MILNSIFIIAKKEILDNVRNKWIIILTIIFASLALVVSYFGSIFSQGWQNFGATISGMMIHHLKRRKNNETLRR